MAQVNYTYDAAGNLLNDGTYSYQWDAEGRLAAVISESATCQDLVWVFRCSSS
jgi:hypothetical protein